MEEKIGFAFNNPNFSNRILNIEVGLSDSDVPNTPKKKTSEQTPLQRKQISTTLHINSLVLASKSPFFFKMFSNGIKESEELEVSLSVKASEELALIDLIRFMYINTLSATTPADLFKVLVLADRYQVVECVTHCTKKLSSLPMTIELALSCQNIPSTILEGDNFHLHSLMDAAKYFLSKNFCSGYEKALELITLENIEKILSWDSLEVDDEDGVYDIVLNWAKNHYKDLNQRCQVFSSRLCQLIRFSYMSCEKLKTVLHDEEMKQANANKMVVVEALMSKIENHQSHANATSICQRRVYRLQPVKVTVLDCPYQECIVYWNLKKEECITIINEHGGIFTQVFHVGNESFNLEFGYELVNGSSEFGMTLWQYPRESTPDALKVDIEIAVRSKVIGIYTSELRRSCTLEKGCGCFTMTGHLTLMDEDSHYFDNGIMYVRVTITLKQ